MAWIGEMEITDVIVVIGYFIVVLGVGIWSSFRNRGSVGGYFLAGRSMHWLPVGASLFASNIGSGHFIGLAGSGASNGIGIAVFELNAIFILMILGWLFVPVYIAAGVYTMPEYLRKRFGGERIRIYLAVLALLLYIFTKISADLYAGALFIEESININLYPAVIILLAISALFTIMGGLTAVIWTDFIQTVIMLLGAFLLMVLSFVKVGGYEALIVKYFDAVPSTARYFSQNGSLNSRPDLITYPYSNCGLPPKNAMNLMRSADDKSLPWPGVIFGLTISSVWYWCSDQVIVQRALAAKNLTNAKAGTILAGLLKLLPMWLLVFPGMAARVLFPDLIGCGDQNECMKLCQKARGCSDNAYPKLVLNLMPQGAKGLMLAVMVASLVSSLTSIFNSSSTIFTMDIWKRFRRNASDMELMVVGRIFVLAMVAIGVAWIPIVQSGGELFHYIQSVTSFLAPPVCAVYVLGIFWKRCNETGAFWSLMVGLVIGVIRFIWENVYSRPVCGITDENTAPSIISDVHYLHFGIILFAICVIVAVCVSLLTPPIADIHLPRLLFWNRYSTETRVDLGKKVTSEITGTSRNGIENIAYSVESDSVKHIGSSRLSLDSSSLRQTETDVPCYRRAFLWICGIDNMQKESLLTDEDRKILEDKKNSIYEDLFWRRVTNISAVALMTCTLFFWGFFS